MFDHESGQLSYKVNLKREKMDGVEAHEPKMCDL